MPSCPARLLCVAREHERRFVEPRCTVLSRSGYRAQLATPEEAETLLPTQRFNLVIFSELLNGWEKGRILSAAGKTPAYVSPPFTMTKELLAEVERLLPPRFSSHERRCAARGLISFAPISPEPR
jgi:hypothetical protein